MAEKRDANVIPPKQQSEIAGVSKSIVTPQKVASTKQIPLKTIKKEKCFSRTGNF